MSWSERTRDGLLAAMLPRPRPGAPDLAALDLAQFWVAFRGAAPGSLRLGLGAAIGVLGLLAPVLLLGRPSTFLGLDAGDRERLLARAAATRLPLFRELVLVLKVVTCFAYFDEGAVQDHFRRGGAPRGGAPRNGAPGEEAAA